MSRNHLSFDVDSGGPKTRIASSVAPSVMAREIPLFANIGWRHRLNNHLSSTQTSALNANQRPILT